ncbi:MAG: phosphohistidine swiveling domain-containing protein [Gammaproteobacteria bacterium]|jgi:phosphohistidine swiveling domain-containing protein
MSDSSYVVAFDDERSERHEMVGGKAASLGRLVKAGFPVPPGFTISTAAYAEFIAELEDPIKSLLGEIDYTDPKQLEAQTAKIRSLIVATDLTVDITDEINSSYVSLSGGGEDRLVAVRSSGTAEDLAQASFAGLHDTFLDVQGADVVDKVKHCWASLWNARAVHYRHEKGFANGNVLIAVVVQKMIPAEVSGVMFTANPLNRRTDEFVINASWGLGEGIVSGILTPDDFVVDRKGLVVKARTLGSKEVKIVKSPSGVGTVRESVRQEDQARYSLSDAEVSELAALGRKVMTFSDELPQDIEWARFNDAFYLLQSRRVTGVEFTWDEDINETIPAKHTEETVWTSTWADDFLTGGVTPLYYSVRVGGEFQRAHDHTNKVYGFPQLENQLIFKYSRATAYFNCDVEKEWNILSLPSRLRNYDYVPHTWDTELRQAKFSLWKFTSMMARLHWLEPKTGIFHWLSDKPGGVYHYLKHRIDEANGPTPKELQTLSDEALEKQIQITRGLADEWVITLWAGFNFWAVGALGTLAVALEKWYDGDNPSAYQDLISGMPNTLMIQESRCQWHLADTIRRSPTLSALFNDNEGGKFFAELPHSEEGRAFLQRYQEMLRDHGHRGHQDRDIYYTRRIEDPAIDYRMLKAYLAGDSSTTPEQTEQRLIAAREVATQAVLANIRQKLFGAIKVKLFKFLLDYVHKFLIQRDDERHYYDRITYQTKKVYAELGRRMFERGLFQEADDFFFLARAELYDFLEGRASRPLVEAKIAARKTVFHRRNRREEDTPPYLVGSRVMEMKARTELLARDPTGQAEAGLKGLGTAAGRISGVARIVPNLDDIGRVQKGDILITNSTDPGWAPVFSIISGLVLETGGLLSHGACLSREYGLPSVLLRNAIKLVDDGASITIDGTSGVVTIDDAPEPETPLEEREPPAQALAS